MFFGRISESTSIETVIAAGNAYCAAADAPKSRANCAPARVAPNVFAIVFAVRIADVVLSISAIIFSRIAPLFLEIFFSDSISNCEVPSTTASSIEQIDEIKSVSATVIIK